MLGAGTYDKAVAKVKYFASLVERMDGVRLNE